MFNKDKANLCTKKMKDYFKDIDNDANVAIPKEIKFGSNDHIIYIFYSCLLDYGMRSKIYHANLINTYKLHKEIFNPKYVVEKYIDNEEELLLLIKDNIHPRYPMVATKKWLYLSKFINDNFKDKDLLECIKELNSYRELYKFITSINGYGQKTGGLLLRLISESGVCSFDDEIEDIPIDRHDVEISYLNGIIDKKVLSEEEIKELGSIWIEVAKLNGLTAIYIDKYLWSIGNSLCSKKSCDVCPLNTNCQKKN